MGTRGHDSWTPEHRAQSRARVEEGMAFARNWRTKVAPNLVFADPVCGRCEGHGLVWWCGLPGMGGRRGPCPRCRRNGAFMFACQLRDEHFPWTQAKRSTP